MHKFKVGDIVHSFNTQMALVLSEEYSSEEYSQYKIFDVLILCGNNPVPAGSRYKISEGRMSVFYDKYEI